jgi:hypothetical protein
VRRYVPLTSDFCLHDGNYFQTESGFLLCQGQGISVQITTSNTNSGSQPLTASLFPTTEGVIDSDGSSPSIPSSAWLQGSKFGSLGPQLRIFHLCPLASHHLRSSTGPMLGRDETFLFFLGISFVSPGRGNYRCLVRVRYGLIFGVSSILGESRLQDGLRICSTCCGS